MLAVSYVICPLISLAVRSNQDFYSLLSVLFCLSSPVPISFYYSLTISIFLSSSKKQHFSENVQSERGEKAGDCWKTDFGFSTWSESIKVCDCNHL